VSLRSVAEFTRSIRPTRCSMEDSIQDERSRDEQRGT
jgi:hypothetical protein